MAGHVILVNPKKRRRRAARASSKWYPVKGHLRNPKPARRRHRSRARVHRNPISLGGLRRIGSHPVMGSVTAAGLGAAGAVAIDQLVARLPAGETLSKLKVGVGGETVKAAIAIGVGLLGKRHRHIATAAQGALTVYLSRLLTTLLPTPPLSGDDMYQLGYYADGMGAYMADTTGTPAVGAGSPALGAYEPSGEYA